MALTDVYFAQGKTHIVCQDYGICDDPSKSDLSDKWSHVMVSDGCSSSPHTDFGARLLVRAAASADTLDPVAIINRADVYRQAMDLPPQSLDATLMVLRENPDGNAEVHVWGDGVIVARRRGSQDYNTWVLSFNLNAPPYLSYLLPGMERKYAALGGGLLTCQSPNGTQTTQVAPGTPFVVSLSRDIYDVVFVFTDGVESFQKMGGTRPVAVPLDEVLPHILDIKVMTSGFLIRRMKRFLGKTCVEKGWQNNDDITGGAMILDPPSEEDAP